MNTREILSDEESQALNERGHSADPQARAPEGQVVDLHADHWERIASDKVPALESISERMTQPAEDHRPASSSASPWRSRRGPGVRSAGASTPAACRCRPA